jgi:hypothetical protein
MVKPKITATDEQKATVQQPAQSTMHTHMCNTVLLDFMHHLNYTIVKLEHFGSWILLLHSGGKRE